MELVDIDWLKEAGPGLPRVPVLGVPVDENSSYEPGGLTTRQVIDLIHATAGHLVAADVVEYNPRFDIGDMTAQVAAKLVREAAGVMLKEAL